MTCDPARVLKLSKLMSERYGEPELSEAEAEAIARVVSAAPPMSDKLRVRLGRLMASSTHWAEAESE